MSIAGLLLAVIIAGWSVLDFPAVLIVDGHLHSPQQRQSIIIRVAAISVGMKYIMRVIE